MLPKTTWSGAAFPTLQPLGSFASVLYSLTGKGHISASQVSRFYDCGLAWYYDKVEHRVRWKSAALVLGSCYHAALQACLEARYAVNNGIDGVVLMTREQVQDTFDSAWDLEISGPDAGDPDTTSKRMNRPEVRFKEKDDPAALKAKGRECVGVWFDRLYPQLGEPYDVEHWFQVPLIIDGETLCELHGRYDLVNHDNGLVDHKMGSRDSTSEGTEFSQRDAYQMMGGYVYAFSQETDGGLPDVVGLDLVTTTKVPKCYRVRKPPDPAYVQKFLDAAANMLRSLEKGQFNRTALGGWMCTQEACDVWDFCPHGSRGEFMSYPAVQTEGSRSQVESSELRVKQRAARLDVSRKKLREVTKNLQQATKGDEALTAAFAALPMPEDLTTGNPELRKEEKDNDGAKQVDTGSFFDFTKPTI